MTGQSAQEVWERSPGFVYFIAAGDPPDDIKAVKIGISTEATLRSRVKRIQGSNHEKIELLGVIPFRDLEYPMKCAETCEQELHKKFEKIQRRKKGAAGHEWFDGDKELIDYITDNAETPPNGLGITKSQVQTGTGSSNGYTEIEEFLDELQQNMNMDDDEKNKVKRFHDALVFPGILQRRCGVEVVVKDFYDVTVFPGYISMLERSLQFKLSHAPDKKYVMLIYANGPKKGRMEINLVNHPKIEPVLKSHVNLDEFPSCNPEKQYPSISWDDWKNRIDQFLYAFEQIAEESWKTRSR